MIRSSTAIFFASYFIVEADAAPMPATEYIFSIAGAILGSLARPPITPVLRLPIREYITLSPIFVPSGRFCKDNIKFLRILFVTLEASSAVKLEGGFIN